MLRHEAILRRTCKFANCSKIRHIYLPSSGTPRCLTRLNELRGQLLFPQYYSTINDSKKNHQKGFTAAFPSRFYLAEKGNELLVRQQMVKLFTRFKKTQEMKAFLDYRRRLVYTNQEAFVSETLRNIGFDVYGTDLGNLPLYEREGILYDFLTLGPQKQIDKIIESREIVEINVKHTLICKVLHLSKESGKHLNQFDTSALFKYMRETLLKRNYCQFYRELIECGVVLNSKDPNLAVIRSTLLAHGSTLDEKTLTFECFTDPTKSSLPDAYQKKLMDLHTPSQVQAIIIHMINQKHRSISPNLIKSYIILLNDMINFSSWSTRLSADYKSKLKFQTCFLSLSFMLKNSMHENVVEAGTSIIGKIMEEMKNELPLETYKTELEKLTMIFLNCCSNSPKLGEPLLKFARDLCFMNLSKENSPEYLDSSIDYKKKIFSKFNKLLMQYFDDDKVLFKFYEKLDPRILEVCNVLLILKYRKFYCNSELQNTFRENVKNKVFLRCDYIDNGVLATWYKYIVLPHVFGAKKIYALFDSYIGHIRKHPDMKVDERVLNLFLARTMLRVHNDKLALILLRKFMTDIPKEQLVLTRAGHERSSVWNYIHLYQGESKHFTNYLKQVCQMMESNNIEISASFIQKIVLRYVKYDNIPQAKNWYDLLLRKNFKITNPLVVVWSDLKNWEKPSYICDEVIEKCKERVKIVLASQEKTKQFAEAKNALNNGVADVDANDTDINYQEVDIEEIEEEYEGNGVGKTEEGVDYDNSTVVRDVENVFDKLREEFKNLVTVNK